MKEVQGVYSNIPYAEQRGSQEDDVSVLSQALDFNHYIFQITHYSVNATWLRRNPTYSIYYIMVINVL